MAAPETSPDPPDDAGAAQREGALPDGGALRVELTGEDADARASRAFRAAYDAVARPLGHGERASGRPIIGESSPMKALDRLLSKVRASDATVLVTGENGTGKELVARAIHTESQRRDGPFVAINCSAFQDQLLESELFGHVRGAFTGAITDKPGRFDVADRGTLFLDEVGEMSPALQVKLLRVLQEGSFLPVGGVDTHHSDARIVAATNRNLEEAVEDGRFREDLYYRLHVVHLRVPPLRERSGDVRLLAEHFLSRLAKRDGRRKTLAPEVLARLEGHAWPGNVRELENEIERLWVLSGDEARIGPDVMSPSVGQTAAPPLGPQLPLQTTLPVAVEALERRMIAAALERHGGNKTRAASDLGVSRRNLIRKVQAYGLDADREDRGRSQRP